MTQNTRSVSTRRIPTPLSAPINTRQQKLEQHLHAFAFSASGIFLICSVFDYAVYRVLRIEHILLMHEVISFTAIGAIFLGLFGIFAVKERATLEPIFYKHVKNEIVPREQIEAIYKKKLLRYSYAIVGAILYAVIANTFVTIIAKFS